ncbi:MAG TPA: PrsW family intramembrane metalloprotease [Methanomassiliicoccaceae archaeon]|nr:PrsW family intramembrane metalloprotease [Methanomassiliicoccaceae archaeon]
MLIELRTARESNRLITVPLHCHSVNGLLGLIIIVIVAFVPAILYLLWVRSAEIYQREPLFAVQGVFLYGMSIALLLALVLETVAIIFIEIVAGGLSIIAYNLILAVILAPIIEEFTKATGVMTVTRRLVEPENGLVYGAAVGLGFAAVENVLYYITALEAGTDVFIATAIARTLTSTLLHTSASALVGFGMSRSRCFYMFYGSPRSWLPYYGAAVVLHAAFNLLASISLFDPTATGILSFIGLILSGILTWAVVAWIQRKIVQLDLENAAGVIRCE